MLLCDVALPMETNVSFPEKYVVPAKRTGKGNQFVTIDSINKQSLAMMHIAPEIQVLQIGTMTFQIVQPKEVKPTFRTPCNHDTEGKMQVKDSGGCMRFP